MKTARVSLSQIAQGTQLSLHAPRANALEPQLLSDIRRALDLVEREDPDVLLITGGAQFCSGGDVARFCDAAKEGNARAYATQVVPQLQDIVARLIALPGCVALAARGAITGGGAGFLFAADLAVIAPGTFVQPYYARMGFAPDGGWTALLPDRLGLAPVQRWLLKDDRKDASELVTLDLAAASDDSPETHVLHMLQDTDPATRRTIKALLWDAPRRKAIETRLRSETDRFFDAIERPETLDRMTRFLASLKR